jgi:CDP-glycerol glycerophosphotransferase (TagB/SpsB family)
LVYYHFFYNYAVQNPDVQLIIRPHVSLFPRAIENQHLSQDDVNEIIGKFTRLDNVVYSQHISKSLVEDIMESDIVIADGTSALAEVVVADKPIIYLSNGLNLEFDSVPLSQEFKKYLYMAYDPRDIIAFLDEIRKNQYAPFQETLCTTGWACKIQKLKNKMLGVTSSRSDFKKMLDPVENPAKFIAEYIWHDTL